MHLNPSSKSMNSNLVKKRNHLILQAKKSIKKGENKKALNYYHTVFQIQSSEKISEAILTLEEKVAQESFPNEYKVIINSQKCDDGFSQSVSNLEKHFKIWPMQKKVSLLLKNSQWDEIDSIWPQTNTCLLDPILVGKYLLEKEKTWDAFLLWQPLLSARTTINKDVKKTRLEESDMKLLADELRHLVSKMETLLLNGLDPCGAKWLFDRISNEQFKTVIHCHVNHFIYEGLWAKGFKFYSEVMNRYKATSWTDDISQSLQMSLKFWKAVLMSDKKGQLLEVEKVRQEIEGSHIPWFDSPQSKKALLHHLSEFFDSKLNPRDEEHWTSLCCENPYKVMGVKRKLNNHEIMQTFAQAIAEKDADLRKLLRFQRLLQDPHLQGVLRFLFLPYS